MLIVKPIVGGAAGGFVKIDWITLQDRCSEWANSSLLDRSTGAALSELPGLIEAQARIARDRFSSEP